MLFKPFLSSPLLASLLSSRICHDLISPVGALNNALELYEEGGMEDDAFHLMGLCARNASARLQFYRLAFGMPGGYGGHVKVADLEKIAQSYMENEKAHLSLVTADQTLTKDSAKIALNLLLLALQSLPRGGQITFSVLPKGPKNAPHTSQNSDITRSSGNKEVTQNLSVLCEGPLIKIPESFLKLYQGQATVQDIDAKAVQFYYTFLLLEENNKKVCFREEAESLTFFTVQASSPS